MDRIQRFLSDVVATGYMKEYSCTEAAIANHARIQ
jgi:hypothetical protein